MSIIKSFSVGNGDMFYIDHNSDNFTIIDCSLSLANRKRIIDELKGKIADKGITRFISTHPDDDHICGLVYLDDQLKLLNFYVVQNAATKDDPTDDFDRYCELRDSTKAFYLRDGCKRKWMNQSGDGRDSSGISVLWPHPDHPEFKNALLEASLGGSPNNLSPIFVYRLNEGPTVMWMGDLETSFMMSIENAIAWPRVDILFAPHHGRDSGKVPDSILRKLRPKLVVIGEAPCDHLNYYPECDTITQNTAGDLTFDCETGWANVYSSSPSYTSTCLTNRYLSDEVGCYYVGSLAVGAVAAT